MAGWRCAALGVEQAVEVEQCPCIRPFARLPERGRLHRERTALAGMARQQIVARGDGGSGVSAIEMGVDVAGLPHLERGVEDIRPERCGLRVGIESLVEPALGIEHVGQCETGLGKLGLDGERLAEGVRGLAEIALGVT